MEMDWLYNGENKKTIANFSKGFIFFNKILKYLERVFRFWRT